MMNRKIGFILCFVALLVASCTKDYLKYDSELTAIKFNYKTNLEDSLIYSFALHPGLLKDTVKIPVQIIGFTASEDRPIALTVDETKSSAKLHDDFELLPSFIESKKLTGDVKVLIKKRDQMLGKALVISLKLKDNESFKSNVQGMSNFRIILTDQLARPSDWPNSFGDYSKVKHEFVIKTIQIGTDYYKINAQQMIYYLGVLTNALYEYNKANPGNPLKDETGRLVTF